MIVILNLHFRKRENVGKARKCEIYGKVNYKKTNYFLGIINRMKLCAEINYFKIVWMGCGEMKICFCISVLFCRMSV